MGYWIPVHITAWNGSWQVKWSILMSNPSSWTGTFSTQYIALFVENISHKQLHNKTD